MKTYHIHVEAPNKGFLCQMVEIAEQATEQANRDEVIAVVKEAIHLDGGLTASQEAQLAVAKLEVTEPIDNPFTRMALELKNAITSREKIEATKDELARHRVNTVTELLAKQERESAPALPMLPMPKTVQ